MVRTRHFLVAYGIIVLLVAVLLGWWVLFFHRQGDFLIGWMEESGHPLGPEREGLVRQAAARATRMFLFEGTFLGTLLLASVYLIVRSLQREVNLHRQEKNFLSAVTHELKSPIASARLSVESLILGRVPEGKRERYLGHVKEALDRLTGQVDNLLRSARVTNAIQDLTLERIDLAEYSGSLLERVASKGEHPEARIELDAPAPVIVRADPSALETILGNLLSNAVKYGGESPRVGVRVREAEDRALLEVIDSGPGLRGADRRRIFEPFVRGKASSEEAQPGVGLGLFLVRELATALGGKVSAQDRGAGGTCVTVSLPLCAEDV